MEDCKNCDDNMKLSRNHIETCFFYLKPDLPSPFASRIEKGINSIDFSNKRKLFYNLNICTDHIKIIYNNDDHEQ